MLEAASNPSTRKSPAGRYPGHHGWPPPLTVAVSPPVMYHRPSDSDDMGAAGVPVLAAAGQHSVHSEPLSHPVSDRPMGQVLSHPSTPCTPIIQSVSSFMPGSPLPGAAGYPVVPSSVQGIPSAGGISYPNHGLASNVVSNSETEGHYNMSNTVPLQHPPNEPDGSPCGFHYRDDRPVQHQYRPHIQLMPPPRSRMKRAVPLQSGLHQEMQGPIVSQEPLT